MKLENPFTKSQYEALLVELTDEERKLVEETSTHNCSGWFYLAPATLTALKEVYGNEEGP